MQECCSISFLMNMIRLFAAARRRWFQASQFSLAKGSPTALRQCKLFVFDDLAGDATQSGPEEEKGEHKSLQTILKRHITSFKVG